MYIIEKKLNNAIEKSNKQKTYYFKCMTKYRIKKNTQRLRKNKIVPIHKKIDKKYYKITF